MKEKPGFAHQVKMWVYEEIIDGKKLTEIINQTHENVKYLKGFSIPENVVRINFTLYICAVLNETKRGEE